jgi:hypothetical protein
MGFLFLDVWVCGVNHALSPHMHTQPPRRHCGCHGDVLDTFGMVTLMVIRHGDLQKEKNGKRKSQRGLAARSFFYLVCCMLP